MRVGAFSAMRQVDAFLTRINLWPPAKFVPSSEWQAAEATFSSFGFYGGRAGAINWAWASRR